MNKRKWLLICTLLSTLILTLSPSDSRAQDDLKRPRKLRSETANNLLKNFNSAERGLQKAKLEREKESAKEYLASHKKLKENLVDELEKALLEETKSGNLDNALEIRSAIRFFERLKSGSDANGAKGLAAENRKLRNKIAALEAQLSNSGQPVNKNTNPDSDEDGEESETTNTIGMQLKLIPAGNFKMGADERKLIETFKGVQANAYAHQLPKHRVRISKPFFIGVHEVTVGQFREFVESANYVTTAEQDPAGGWGYDGKSKFIKDKKYSWRNTGFAQEENHPVVNVSWLDAVEFCKWLSNKENVQYHLPTEAQWEYACRAGTDTMFYAGDDPAVLMSMANIADATLNSKLEKQIRNRLTDGSAFTNVVGQYSPNKAGLYDMVGNVGEWCHDFFDRKYYNRSPLRDPRGADNGVTRVMRGWGFRASTWQSRSADRFHSGFVPNHYEVDLGFRVVRVSE